MGIVKAKVTLNAADREIRIEPQTRRRDELESLQRYMSRLAVRSMCLVNEGSVPNQDPLGMHITVSGDQTVCRIGALTLIESSKDSCLVIRGDQDRLYDAYERISNRRLALNYATETLVSKESIYVIPDEEMRRGAFSLRFIPVQQQLRSVNFHRLFAQNLSTGEVKMNIVETDNSSIH